MDKNSWYINRFRRSWTILDGIFHGCVLLGQYWLVNQPVLSFMDSNGWFISMFCPLWTIMVGISPSFFLSWTKIGWYINRISLLWTILAVILTGFVCHGQYWLVNPPVLSVVNNIGCYISLVCVP